MSEANLRRTTSDVGHIPHMAGCMACGLAREPAIMPHEPCPAQPRARALVDDGYIALPASPEEFDSMVKAARGD